MAPYTLQQVVATSSTEALVAARIAFPAPAWEVLSIQKTVLIDKADITLGSALLQGRLRACYTLTGPPDHPAAGGPTITWQAPLSTLWAETHFCLALPIAKAVPEQSITVTTAHVCAQVVTPHTDGEGRLTGLDDQSMLQLAVRLTRLVDLHTPPSPRLMVVQPTTTPGVEPPRQVKRFARFDSRSSR